MNGMLSRRRQSGALLLTVALLLATIAALAFSVNRAAGMDVQSVAAEHERRSAAYLAEGALAAARWTNEINRCSTSTPLDALTLANATLSAKVSKGSSGKRLNIVATAITAGGASATLARNDVDNIDLANTETKDMGGTPRDTYLTFGIIVPAAPDTLKLTSNYQHTLLYWPMNDIPGKVEVLSARLLLTQNGSSGVARTVNVHRVTSQWDSSATWKLSHSGFLSGTSWTSTTTALGSDGGGDYSAPAVASTRVSGAGTYAWDVTGLVDGWVGGRLVNYGMLLRLPDPGQSVDFYSLEADNSSRRPILRVTFAKQC
jgi:hypothetical protein